MIMGTWSGPWVGRDGRIGLFGTSMRLFIHTTRTERLVRGLERGQLVGLNVAGQFGRDVEEVRVVVYRSRGMQFVSKCEPRLNACVQGRIGLGCMPLHTHQKQSKARRKTKRQQRKAPEKQNNNKRKQNKKRTAEALLAERRAPAGLELPGVVGLLIHVRGVEAPGLQDVDLHLFWVDGSGGPPWTVLGRA